ncbi:choice-of-anchor D domain-containing protein [Oceanihabitans sp. 2_MG-2023]|uniref:choice-of-anchor D domain-containing protein n=1 Tax=Oceanihabitans sp. 2_MG-2023 TaxID=3062661 RepID=UPI0026E218DA|nr:choice-of-anchor D domain-containing protein [Oceanihabitans sp. 2_MG-2023]MDO6596978.1 choice-of-anchor D domain-containing protein [Oceanihabitans sp. 2_MG-2023]
MRTFINHIKRYAICISILLLTSFTYSQTTIASYDFDSGLQGWTDGGSDAGISSWNCSGTNSIYSKDNTTGSNLMTSPVLDLSSYTSVDFSFCGLNSRVDNGEGFNLLYFDGTNWLTLYTYIRGTDFTQTGFGNSYNLNFVLDSASYTLPANAQFRFSSTANDNNEYNLFDDVLIEGYAPSGPEISITGNGQNINDGDATPNVTDDTNFGNINLGFPASHTFTINNPGSLPLTIGTLTFSGANPGDFTITSPPASSIAASGSTTFTVEFDPAAVGVRTAILTIVNNDANENPFNFTLQGTGEIPSYCTSNGNGSDGYDTGTRLVVFNTINNATPDEDNDYSDFTAINTTVNQGNTYNLTVNANTDGNYTTQTYVWIDWNQDLDFDDAGEEYNLGTANNTNNGATSLSPLAITVPIGATIGNTRMRVSTRYNNAPSNCDTGFDGEVEDYTIIVASGTPQPEINVVGNGQNINDGDTTPAAADDTDFGTVNVVFGTQTNTFTIQNSGSVALNLTGASPYVSISGLHPGDFTLNANPTTPISAGGSTTFEITFNPSAAGLRSAIITIANDDSDEDPYTFTIQGNGFSIAPEINLQGNATTILDGDTTPSPLDATDFGSASVSGGTQVNTFTIQNSGSLNLNLTGGAPYVVIGGANAADFTVTATPNASIAAGGSTTFEITFDPSALGTRTATVTIENDDSDEDPYTFTIQGAGATAPGGVNSDLALWLKSTDGLGYTDGQPVALWVDQGNGADASVNTAGQEPTYYDNTSRNINFNPVVEFDNTFSTFSLDSDYSYDNTSTQFLEGASGMYTQEIFLVIIPDDTPINRNFGFMDVFCGDADFSTNATDATGIGFGDFTGRVSNESICFAIDTYTTSIPGDGYAVNDGPSTSYSNVGIINARNNSAVTQQELYYNANNIESNQNDIPSFVNVNNSRYWLGRSEGWEATTNARIAEVITYSNRKIDTDLTVERNRIQSYLAIKYGITLGVNGTTQDYVDSNGSLIWDQSENVGFNYDIAGIGRDNDSDLNQKQSRSVNNATDGLGRTQGILTMGLTDIYDTNNLNQTNNSTDLNDKEFLVWGNNGADLNLAASTISVDMSAGIGTLTTNVTFTGMQRIWKVVENGGDIPSVKISIPQAAVRNITPPGNYYMFISDSPVFDPTASYRLMTANGANLETDYDFDGTKYITFGYAPQVIVERSIYFDGAVDYIDMEDKLNLNASAFTISAWINRDSRNVSILSKRDAAYTEGYDFKILNNRRLEMSWGASGANSISSSIAIPENEWHQVAVSYDGTTAKMYIDGVLDNTESLPAPTTTNQYFYIGAAGKNTPTAHFRGNIDEVRIWDTALTQTQLQYIMNQEIVDNSAFVDGKIMPTTVTKNDIISIPWSQLAGYYPMSIYTYTNTEDESGKGNQGYLRNLNTVDHQTAPLPYRSNANGDWNTNATWLNGNVQTIPGTASIVDNTITVDWNIVVTNHNVTMDNASLPSGNNENRSILGLFVNSNELTVAGDNTTETGNALTISHYLNLDGKIDLEGESQLIQTEDSDLNVTSAGTIEKDQQGTQDYYTYNYWSSPVGVSNTTSNNNSYTLSNNIFKDGSNPLAPVNMNFISGYNGANGTPISIADYWIWKYANLADDYYNWQHVRSTGTIFAGEGFTMKGVDDTSDNLSLKQNYVVEGKPNNGVITLPINNNNDYLVGNPYASAIDADRFILDNTNTTGAIYYWEHFGGGTHNTIEYEGGYAVYNLSGGVQAIQYDYVTGGVDLSGGTGTKTPGRYIPVAQGFFVIGSNNGTINFNNNQRTFTKEGVTSTFIRSSNNNEETDNRLKLRLGFESSNTYKRQLLITRDDQATNAIDFGYDAENKDEQNTDMFWMINNEKFVIQGTNVIDEATVLPIGIKTSESGINTFNIDALIHFPEELQVYIHDKTLNTYHNLKNSDFQIDLPAGEYLERFEITFNNQSLSIAEVNHENIETYFVNDTETMVINNPKSLQIEQAKIINMLGQEVYRYDEITNKNYIELKTKNLSVGSYIISLKTEIGEISKKVLVN